MKITVTKKVAAVEKTVTVEDNWETAVTPEDVAKFVRALEELNSSEIPRKPGDPVFGWLKHMATLDSVRKMFPKEGLKKIDDVIRTVEPDFIYND